MGLTYLRPADRLNEPYFSQAPGVRAKGALGAGDVLHLAELVPIVRDRLDVDEAMTDDAILASLRAITQRSAPRERWRAAFDSNLGHWLALKGSDLNTQLNTLIALLPRPTS